jgi:uncharacterized membrane protein YgcG
MRFRTLTAFLCTVMLASYHRGMAQDSTSFTSRLRNFPGKLFSRINNKADQLSQQLDKQTASYLRSLSKQEARLKKQLYKTDSASAKELFAQNAGPQYTYWLQKMKADSSAKGHAPGGAYYPYVDSLQTSMHFLQQNPGLLNPSKVAPAGIQNSIDKLQVLQNKMQDADEIKQYIQQRNAQIKGVLARLTQLPSGLTNTYTNYTKQYYYYSQQVQSYKDMMNDPDKMTSTALRVLTQVPAFTRFFKNQSMLAGTFNLPGKYDSSTTAGKGLPGREEVVNSFQNQYGKGGPDMTAVVQKSVQSAQESASGSGGSGNIGGLSDKLSSLVSGGGDLGGGSGSLGNSGGSALDMPNFQPNSQNAKSFLKRLVFGIDLQTVHSSYFFPATSDIGVSLGYKLNDNNSVGLGASYKVGWGQDINHIRISSQGASIRSFGDFRIKKSFFASGGFEYNYQQPFLQADFPPLKSWQQSGLIGISKIISLKTKAFKTTKISILWDFLSYQQVPRTQPFKFRVGYSF